MSVVANQLKKSNQQFLKKVKGYNVKIELTDDGFYVGQLIDFPEVISQGKTLKELKENLIDAYNLIVVNDYPSDNTNLSIRATK